MNYIRQLSAFYLKAAVDDRLTASHISLYHALFQFWNMNRFKKPVFVNRPVLMRYSKIGSNHTLYRCLNELHKWGYIKYTPSYSPKQRSYVNMAVFDTNQKDDAGTYADNAPDLCKNDIGTCAKSAQEQCNFDIGTCAILHCNINNSYTNIIKTLGEENKQAQNSEKEISGELKIKEENKKSNTETLKRKKVAPKKEKGFKAPSLQEVLEFFSGENYLEKEGRKFYYHFEANGWKVGGKSPMKNWKAAAHNWMLNAEKYAKPKIPNSTNLNIHKDYGEPL